MFRLSMPILLFMLAGCATTPYGNFVAANDEAHNKSIAHDVTQQLIALYPPATTQFKLQHPTADSFGDALVDSLRTGGYAIIEHQKQRLNKAAEPTISDGMTLGYIFDRMDGLYRLTVLVDQHVLTRAYSSKENTINPAGYWVRKE
ncbi:conjugative transfer protein TrbH [Nitrosomonas sp. Nm84]|uniref:conjugal transfer protein TrbH n=1 Tax=Nitrosomonas sp. Nm84 TaxID=200124 RepID=UPI000D75EEEB|nr:conjugal transfer protein TrbH [Nitrosomonas sp. Nm84]PXW89086.1 conjugative transfer protein TrbH [Nitrosomonas sp. Nm84]